MIPIIENDLSNVQIVRMPSKNHRMNFIDRIFGKVDTLDAMKQVCYKILLTERYQYLIYSWNYGIELADLFGQPVNYCIPEIQRRITEALLADDRVKSVDNFKFDTSKKKEILCTFTVHSIFGEFEMEKTTNV